LSQGIGKFQSSPLIAEGRNRAFACHGGDVQRFQSSPLIAEGRNLDGAVTARQSDMFQSSPLIAEGRNSGRCSELCRPTGVSILAPHR